MAESIWVTLGVDTHASETEIRRAYARRLKTTRPDDDPVAFQTLRVAYERAMQIAASRAPVEKRNSAMNLDVALEPSLTSSSPLIEKDRPNPSDPTQPVEPTAIPDRPIEETTRNHQPNLPFEPSDSRREPPLDAPGPSYTSPNARTHEPHVIAQAAWQRFIAQQRGDEAERIAFVEFLRDSQLTNLAVREVFEQICAAYCASADADPALRLAMADTFEWEKDHGHLLRAQPQIGHLALGRVKADALYKDLSDFDPKVVDLFSQPPPTVKHAQAKLMMPLFVIKLSKAFELAQVHSQVILAYRFNMAAVTFWAAQLQARFRDSYRISGILIGLWLMLIVGAEADAFYPTQYFPTQFICLTVSTIMIGSGLVSKHAWIHWPEHWRLRYRAARTRDRFLYGWIVLWFMSTAVVLQGKLPETDLVEYIGIAGLLASAIWAFAAVPRTLEPWPFIFAPTVSALFGAQVIFTESHGARALFWPLLQGPLVSAFFLVQPMLSLRLRAKFNTWWLLAVAWLTLAAAVGLSTATLGLASTVHALVPIAMPLLAFAAVMCPPLTFSKTKQLWGLRFAVLLANAPGFEVAVFPVWIFCASGMAIWTAIHRGRTKSEALSRLRATTASSLFRYRAERYSNATGAMAFITGLRFTALAGVILAASVFIEPTRVPLIDRPLMSPPQLRLSKPTAPPAPDPRTQHLTCNAVQPRYPIMSQRRNETGLVVIEFVVGEQGNVESARVKTSSGFEELDKAALAATLASQCKPLMKDGHALRAISERPYQFSLSN